MSQSYDIVNKRTLEKMRGAIENTFVYMPADLRTRLLKKYTVTQIKFVIAYYLYYKPSLLAKILDISLKTVISYLSSKKIKRLEDELEDFFDTSDFYSWAIKRIVGIVENASSSERFRALKLIAEIKWLEVKDNKKDKIENEIKKEPTIEL